MDAPRLPWLFKISTRRSPNRFEYKPRFYNAHKEELEIRERKIMHAIMAEKKLAKKAGSAFRNNIDAGWVRNYRKIANKHSTIRLLVILAMFIFIASIY